MASEASKPSVLSTLPKELPLDFLKTITDYFSDERIICTDAFGTIYKGIAPDGEVIAVKKFSENGPVARDKAFSSEVTNIMALRHENIVRLLAYCHEGQKKVVENNGRYILADVVEELVCYEYLPKGSLGKNLFDQPTRIEWSTRFKIIKGICEGVLFLHSRCILHMDIKPDNIWLDDNFVPKITNFGLSILFGQEQTEMHKENVVGSYGYIAPEYLYRGHITAQIDIYCLGMLIIEITTGVKNCPENEPAGRRYIDKIRTNWTAEHIASQYASLDADHLEQVHTCINIGLQCVEIDRNKRPSIEKIVEKLCSGIMHGD